MKKSICKKIIAMAVVVIIAATSWFVIRGKLSVWADNSVVAGTTYYNAEELEVYNNGTIDWVNGEKTLKAEDKANVLANIMENKQKLTILEIVPYELASVFQILIPDQEQSDLMASYGEEIFDTFNVYDGDNVRILNSQNGAANNITDDGQPITVYANKVDGVSDSQKLDKAVAIADAVINGYLYTNSTTADEVLSSVNNAIASVGATAEWSTGFSNNNSQSGTDGSVSGEITVQVGDVSSSVSLNQKIFADYKTADLQDYFKASVTRDILTKITDSTTNDEIDEIAQAAVTSAFEKLSMDGYIVDYWWSYCEKTETTGAVNGKIHVDCGFFVMKDWSDYSSYTLQYDISLNDKASYSYSAEIENYYLDRLLEGYEDTSIYEYFSAGNVEVKTVIAGQLTSEDLFNEADPVDIIYVAGYATDLQGHIYRNAFFQQPIADAATAVDFLKNGTADDADELFSTNVYHKVGNEYVEYTFSELISESVWYDSYTKIGNDYVPNELNWTQVKLIMEYIFGGYNTNYKYIYYDDDGTEHSEIQRVSCMYQISAFANSGEVTADNNMAKLYYLLCKTTDQPNTTALDKDIKTYYKDDDYFYKKYFTEKKADGTPYTYDNGITTAAYNDDVDWTLYFSAQGDVKWFFYETTEAVRSQTIVTSLYNMLTAEEQADFNSQLAEKGSLWILNQTKEYYLFLTSWCNDGRYIPYNGVLGLLNRNGVDLLKPYTDQNWSDSGARLPGVENRLDGSNYTTISINNYFLGVDESDFITKPDAMFTTAEFTEGADVNTVAAEMASNENAFVVYMYTSDVQYDNIRINFKANDSNGKLVSGNLTAHYRAQNESGMYVDKTVAVKEYTTDELAGKKEFTDYYDITKDNAELYEAFMNKTLYFTFTVKNEVEGKKKTYTLDDTAYLYFVYRQLKDLD